MYDNRSTLFSFKSASMIMSTKYCQSIQAKEVQAKICQRTSPMQLATRPIATLGKITDGKRKNCKSEYLLSGVSIEQWA